jgi:hypothetical protein
VSTPVRRCHERVFHCRSQFKPVWLPAQAACERKPKPPCRLAEKAGRAQDAPWSQLFNPVNSGGSSCGVAWMCSCLRRNRVLWRLHPRTRRHVRALRCFWFTAAMLVLITMSASLKARRAASRILVKTHPILPLLPDGFPVLFPTAARRMETAQGGAVARAPSGPVGGMSPAKRRGTRNTSLFRLWRSHCGVRANRARNVNHNAKMGKCARRFGFILSPKHCYATR